MTSNCNSIVYIDATIIYNIQYSISFTLNNTIRSVGIHKSPIF